MLRAFGPETSAKNFRQDPRAFGLRRYGTGVFSPQLVPHPKYIGLPPGLAYDGPLAVEGAPDGDVAQTAASAVWIPVRGMR
jgi:hypothetical protein